MGGKKTGLWSKMGNRHRANRRFRPVAVNTARMGTGRGVLPEGPSSAMHS